MDRRQKLHVGVVKEKGKKGSFFYLYSIFLRSLSLVESCRTPCGFVRFGMRPKSLVTQNFCDRIKCIFLMTLMRALYLIMVSYPCLLSLDVMLEVSVIIYLDYSYFTQTSAAVHRRFRKGPVGSSNASSE